MVKSYLELREVIDKKNRGLRDKVMSLEDAIGLIRDGDHVASGGCHYSGTAMAAVWEMIRQKKKDITYSRSISSTEGDLLLVGGVVRRIVTSWFSPGVTWGVSRVMRHYMEKKLAEFEEWSHMSLGLRYRAGAMGVPFIPARSMLGSDLFPRLADIKEIDCPYTGEKLALIPALNPDVAILHTQRCDAYGNVQSDGFPFMDRDIALAADKVIVTTERIVSNDQIRRAPDRTGIGFFCVDAVVEVPYGSLPHECYGQYQPAFKHMDYYVKLMMGKGPDGVKEYLDEYVYSPASWNEYIEKIGFQNILEATTEGRGIYND
ncbi:MAG: CoA transferase subunit A [Deltaproteobacteria bacterium]|nr:CoA transferase subunit A [Deltaproteobacteria bacterium]